MRYNFTVNTKAIGKARPRFNTYTKATYTPQKTKNYEEIIKNTFQEKYGLKINPSPNAIHIKIDVEYAPAKSYSKKKKDMLIDEKVGYMHKPDADNIAKAVLDALNGVVWLDDRQVVELVVLKAYGKEDKVNIEIMEVD